MQVADVPQDERSGSKGIAETGPLTLGGGIYSPLGTSTHDNNTHCAHASLQHIQ